jgi:hypothetical protein
LEFAVDAQDGRVARGHVKVRSLLFEHQVEKCIYFGHKSSSVGGILTDAAVKASNDCSK